MSEPRFFAPPSPLGIDRLAEITGCAIERRGPADLAITGIAPLDRAGPADLVFLDNQRYAAQLAGTGAGACIVSAKNAGLAPAGAAVLVAAEPYVAFARATLTMFPDAARPQPVFATAAGVSPGAVVHPDARLEVNVTIDPGAVVGPGAEVGSGSVIGANAVIGPEVRIGRNCSIGPGCTVQHALLGDRVILHPGVQIGQDGFGFALGRKGHLKVPQLGRVVVQDDVEIGAGSTIDRGANRETVIGEGTKIDNLVQIGHNTVIGRHCVIVAQSGISGSVVVEDGVVLGGKAGVIGHVRIGAGARIAAGGNVISDVPPGATWGGHVARPRREWLRELATLRRLAAERGARPGVSGADEERDG